jgi:hypothetical protein
MYSRYWSSALPHIHTHELLLAKFLRSLFAVAYQISIVQTGRKEMCSYMWWLNSI